MQRFDNPTKLIQVAAGETFAVTLAGNPTTGYTWQVGVDQQHLELIDQTYTPGGEGVGAGGQEVFTFRARAAGKTGIACEYRRPWDKEARETKRIEVIIE
jgi:inhibitor of cysteine peptidase